MTKQSAPFEATAFSNADPLLKAPTSNPSVSKRNRSELRTPKSSSTTYTVGFAGDKEITTSCERWRRQCYILHTTPFSLPELDLAQSLSTPARIASRTSSERPAARILVITFAR